jgi:membrane protease YdiL (CAAX protease family)
MPTTAAGHQPAITPRPQCDQISQRAATSVPWGWVDLAWVVGATLGALGALVLLMVTAYVSFITAERHHVLPYGSLSAFVGHLGPYETAAFDLLISVILYGVTFYAVYRHTVRKYHVPWTCLYLRAAGWRTYCAMVALFLPVTVGLGAVLSLEQAWLGHKINNPQHASLRGIEHLPPNVVLIFLSTAVLAPFVEEIFFRGFLYRLLRTRLPIWAAVVVSAALFAAAHGIPVLFPALFYAGVVYALVVERTKSLYCSMILHGLQNSVFVLGYFLITAKH